MEASIIDNILFRFSIMDSGGNDLLNPSFNGNLMSENIRVYEKIDGRFIKFDDSLSAFPKGYDHFLENKVFWFTPHYQVYGVRTHELKIVWGELRTDYVLVQCAKSDNVVYAYEIWFNGCLVWNVEKDTERAFTVFVD